MASINITIYDIPHTQDGNGYDLSHAKPVYRVTTNTTEYAAQKSKALIKAGMLLGDTNAATLLAIRDDAESDATYIHRAGHGLSVLTGEDATKAHLRDRYWGMKLIGSLPEKPRKASKDEILAKLDEWAKYAFAEEQDDDTVEEAFKAGLELWDMATPYMSKQQYDRFDREWYGVCDPDTLKGIILEALGEAN